MLGSGLRRKVDVAKSYTFFIFVLMFLVMHSVIRVHVRHVSGIGDSLQSEVRYPK